MSLIVTLFRDFPEDQRISMDVYANSIRDALYESGTERCAIREHTPRLPRVLDRGTWSMRFARYAVYPLQVQRYQSQVNHILDQGYGHLLCRLDPARTVVTVHDLIPLARWRGAIPTVPRGQRPWLNLLSFYALRRARYLIAISENTRQDLIRFLGCKPENVVVVHYGLEKIFRVYDAEERAHARRKWNCPNNGTRRVLISGAQFYKNPSTALHAYTRLRTLYEGPLELVKVGPPNPTWDQMVRACGLRDSIRYIGAVLPSEMPQIYNCIDLLLFPSLYEGFGRPPLEAMACGVPVVTSNAEALPESVGDAGIMCDPQDVEGLAHAMFNLLSDSALRDMFVQRGLQRAQQFSWKENACKTLEVYEQIVRDSSGLQS